MDGDVVLVDGARTAIGSFGGGLANVPAATLGARVGRAALERARIADDQVDEVIFGCVGQVGRDAYLARAVGMQVGLPVEIPAVTVNRLCGSGLQAINSAVQTIRSGDAEVVLAGGTENMSSFPFLSHSQRWGSRLGHAEMEDALLRALHDPFTETHMGVTAENIAERWGISRAEQDEFALESQQRTGRAVADGRFTDQIVGVEVKAKGGVRVVDKDEHPRPETTLERLSTLSAAFQKGGTVTAGNASGINDGAAAVLVASAARAAALGLKPKLRVVAHAVAGVEPEIMGMGPVPAVRKALGKAGLTVDDLDVIELNEAFAAQALACIRELHLDMSRVNVNGGAIALGHPVGATGCVLTVKLMHEMMRREARYGMVTACIGGGQGIATIFERIEG
jgi:acetyl-CoA C-acetyltransferase